MKHISQTPAPQATDQFAPRRSVARSATAPKLPRFDPSQMDPYLLAHNGDSWELIEIGVDETGDKVWAILPVFSTIRVRPGVNGVEMGIGKMPPAPDKAIRRAVRNGDTVLEDWDEYLYVVDGANGPGHFLFHESVYVYPNGRFDVRRDMDAWNDWRQRLIDDGRLEAPPTYALTEMRKRLNSAIARCSASDHPTRKRMHADYAERLEAFDKLVADMNRPINDTPPAAPRSTAKAAKKKAPPKAKAEMEASDG